MTNELGILQTRTSGAKALTIPVRYGTAKPVPFVRVFPKLFSPYKRSKIFWPLEVR
jgi:hypothetical protein